MDLLQDLGKVSALSGIFIVCLAWGAFSTFLFLHRVMGTKSGHGVPPVVAGKLIP